MLFHCGDVTPGCDTSFHAETEVQVLRELTAHAWTAHALDQPHLPARTTTQVLAAITHPGSPDAAAPPLVARLAARAQPAAREEPLVLTEQDVLGGAVVLGRAGPLRQPVS